MATETALRIEDFKGAEEVTPKVRLDIGCGINKLKAAEGEDAWTGVDVLQMEGVDVVVNLCQRTYEWVKVPVSTKGEGGRAITEYAYEKVHAGYEPWPWEDNSVDEIHCSHFAEHFGGDDRTHIFNEIYRVLKPDAQAKIIVPSWTSGRAYGDPTHCWPPFALYSFYYLDKNWRMGGKMGDQEVPPNAPHADASNVKFGYACDFGFTAIAAMDGEVCNWAQERQAYALKFCIEAALDLHCTLTKRVS